jgi:uncharacterized membrane protein YraQ (UPF0718 family)
MAPYLLLGFVIAGLLRIFFTEGWVRRHLGQKGLYQIFKAVVIGIPLPLCSCGVIPVAAGIRRQGGQKGAVAAFAAATPQTGVDAILATSGMLGWVFALVRVVIAFVNGIIAGLVVEKWGDGRRSSVLGPQAENDKASSERSCCCSSQSDDRRPTTDDLSPSTDDRRLSSGLKFGLVTLPGDLFMALVIGLILAGIISVLAPADLFTNLPGGQFGIYLGMTLLSLPLYICSTGSIPMAFTFLQAGMSPGAVLIFLIAGPASNTATVAALWKIIGPRGTLGYILSIVLTSWVVAFLIDFSGISLLVMEAVHAHDTGISPVNHFMAGILVAILAWSRIAPHLERGKPSCCEA